MWNASVVDAWDFPDYFGYHVNISRANVPSAAMVAAVVPDTPNVVWSQDPDTVFLLFADEDEARALMPGLWIADLNP